MSDTSRLLVAGCLAILASCVCVVPASAGAVDLGGGWQASWDSSLDPYVDINVLSVTDDAIFLQKSAEFTQGPVAGVFPSIPIVFRQTGASTIQSIVLDDEIIANSTGVDWTDFHIDLLNGLDAWFDEVQTGQSGGPGPIGFYIGPFTEAAFTSPRRLDISGGVVAGGQVWFPGDGAANGQLWIGVVSAPSGAPGTLFTLKETPTPEPGSLALLGLGGLAVIRRRRQ